MEPICQTQLIVKTRRFNLLKTKQLRFVYVEGLILYASQRWEGNLKKCSYLFFFLQYWLWFLTDLRWLDWIFWGGYLPSLSINYVAMSKDMGKRLPQLYYIKMKISYDLGFIAIGVAMAT